MPPPPDAPAGLDGAFRAAPFGLVLFDQDLRVAWANPRLAARFGRQPEQLYGRRLAEVEPDLDPEIERLARSVRDGLQRCGRYLLRGHTRDSRRYALDLLFFPDETTGRVTSGVFVLVLEATSEVEASANLAIATERLHLLAELGGRLSATLDVDRILQLAAELLLPVLGDACAVDALADDALDDPERHEVLRASWALGSRLGPPATVTEPPVPVAEVLRSGLLRRYATVPGGLVGDGTVDRPGNAIVVPMRARGQVVGAVSLARFAANMAYGTDEIAFALEVASRVAMAVDNARLYAHERAAAVTLQHALLPDRLPEVPGVDLAARYIAGSERTEVGGDWFDVTPRADGRIALVIGDVMGRGLRAAAVMGQLRAAVRAYTVVNLPPGRLLAYLDRVVTSLDLAQLVTCLYGVLDPAEGTFTYARAGHPVPLLRGVDGTVAAVESPSAPPLGALDLTGEEPVEQTTPVPPGTTLLLYTDGLVEERHVDIGVRTDLLHRTLAAATGGPEHVADSVLGGMGRTGGHSDDVALLAVHLHRRGEPAGAGGPSRDARFTVTGGAASVASARHFVGSVLDRWGLGGLRDAAELLVSETVTNAVLHATGTADLLVHRAGAGVEVEVRDLDVRLPTPRIVDAGSESGRGLYLLEQLSSAWGAEPTYAGKRVWFRLEPPDG